MFFGKNAKYLERFLHKTIRKNRKNKDIATKKQKVWYKKQGDEAGKDWKIINKSYVLRGIRWGKGAFVIILTTFASVCWWSDGGRNPIGRRTESDWTANGIRSDGGRNLIGRRTQSNRTADAIWSGGGRNPIGRRTRTTIVCSITRKIETHIININSAFCVCLWRFRCRQSQVHASDDEARIRLCSLVGDRKSVV